MHHQRDDGLAPTGHASVERIDAIDDQAVAWLIAGYVRIRIEHLAARRARWRWKGCDSLESRRSDFYELLVREAGKTLPDAISEVRKPPTSAATTRCRRECCSSALSAFPDPRVSRTDLSLQGRGVFACISPWNFPLAIFAGQTGRGARCGNAVVAKPAEPTPLVAARFVSLLHESGVTPEALQFVPAPGRAFGEIAFRHPALAALR